MADKWTIVEARGELAAGTAQLLLRAAERAGLPTTIVRSVYEGFEVPEMILEYLNDEGDSDVAGRGPGSTEDLGSRSDKT